MLPEDYQRIVDRLKTGSENAVEAALQHSKKAHGDDCLHSDCEECLNIALEIMRVNKVSPRLLQKRALNEENRELGKLLERYVKTKEDLWTGA